MKKRENITIIISTEQRFAVEKPRYNAHQTGHGVHASKKKYTRKCKHKGREVE